MKKMYLLAVAFIGLSLGQASAGSMPLAKLAGSYAGDGSATYGVCFTAAFAALSDCATSADVAFFSEASVLQGTSDKNGNSCTTIVTANGPEFPAAPPAAANSQKLIQVGKTTSYDPTTGMGVATYTTYLAGTGTSCNGSVLVNTANAPVSSHSTGTVVVSEHGTRIDGVTTVFHNTPLDDVADFVSHAVAFKQ